MLGNTSGLTGNYIRLTDIVKQRSLTVVNVSHHRYNRSARLQIFRSIFFFNDSLCHFRTYIFSLESEFFSHQIDGFSIQTLVDGNHDTNTHTSSDNLVNRNIHHRCQFVSRNELGQLQYLAVCHFLIFQFLYLFCYVFLAHFLFDNRFLEAIFIVVISSVVISLSVGLATLTVTIAAFTLYIRSWSSKVGSCNIVNVHLLFIDTVTFLLVSSRFRTVLRSALRQFRIILTDFLDDSFLHQLLLILTDFFLFFTFATFLFLRFLLGTSRLIQCSQVDLTDHINLCA